MSVRVLLFFLALTFCFGFSQPTNQTNYADPVVLTITQPTHRFQVVPESGSTPVLLQGLEAGATYQVSVIQDSGDCRAEVGEPQAAKAHSMFVFTAESKSKELRVNLEFEKEICRDVVYLTLVRHQAEYGPPVNLNQLPVLTVSGASSPQQLVEDVLIGGGCFSVDGVNFAGATSARGTFANGLTNIGINEGVILSSGPISAAPGPNNQTGAGGPTGGGSDPDLAQLAGTSINDAAVLSFQFEPTEPTVTFSYVFASEEYCDFVNSGFNDAFGFFISGPGINGPYSNNAENLAIIPGTATPVTINNVNHMTNPAYYVSNVSPDDAGQLATPGCAGTPFGTFPIINEVQYDGFTVVLTATANVIPCEVYTIKLAVGDAVDNVFDSAVFLEANSFDAGGEGEVEASNPLTGDNHAYESCDQGFLTFTRTAGDPSLPLTINFTIGGTATPDVDYAALPTSVMIPPFVNQIQIPINIFDDAIVEGIENILIILDQPCNCDSNTAEFFIEDLPPLNVALDDQEICAGLPVIMEPTVSGGVEPYFYQWSNGSPAPTYIDVPLSSGTVSVTVTDFCGQETVATANVDIFTLEAEITGTGQICTPGDEANLTINFTGEGPWDVTYTIDGEGPFNANGITENPYTLVATEPGVYEIVAITSGGCLGEGLGTAEVTSSDTELGGSETDLQCAGDANGSIDLEVTGNTGPYTYDWSNGVQVEDPANLPADTYTVTVTDDAGCVEEISFTIDEPTVIDPQVISTDSTDCSNPTGGSIDLEVSGGAGGYTYNWSNGDTIQDPTGLSAGTYNVVVTDANGCSANASATVSGDSSVPEADVEVLGQIDCINTELMLDGTGSTTGPGIIYEWTASNGGNITSPPDAPSVDVDAAGTYQLTVTNTNNGCFSTSSVIVQADLNTPVADAGPAGELTCDVLSLNLNGNGSSSGNNIAYDWTTPDGNFSSPTDITNPEVDAPGTYQLIVTNTDNGCADTSLVQVSEDVAIPVANAGGDETIDCVETSVVLDGSGSSNGPEFTYQWTTPDGNIVTGADTPMPEVDAGGTYQLVVTNTENGCVDSTAILVDDLGDEPIISILDPDILTCDLTSLILDGSGSSSGPDFTYNWTTSNGGNIVQDGNTLTPLVDEDGTYTLEITNTVNGCVSIQAVDVTANQTSPVADAGPAFEISCTDPQINLDGSGSSSGANIVYEWITVSGGNIVSGGDTTDPLIDAPGTYQLTVTNTDNGCQASSIIEVTGDSETPVATATGPGDLNCTSGEVTINGSGSSIGNNYSYEWTTADGNIVTGINNLFLTVNGAGTYTLAVTNTNNDCVSTTNVTVGIDTLPPDAVIQSPDILTCSVTELQLDGSGSSSGPDMNYVWSTSDGNIVSGDSTITPLIDAPGTYDLLVTNTDNGCASTTQITVAEDVAIPAADAVVTEELNCAINSLQIDGSGSSTGSEFTYNWTTPDGNILSGADGLQPEVDAPGTYELLVTNTDNDCISTVSVAVDQDIAQPTADPGTAQTLTCVVTEQSLDAGASAPFPDLNFTWTTPDGNIISGTDSAQPLIDAPGTYQLVVTDNNNACVDTALITVDEDIVPPLAEAGSTFELDCNATALNLDGAASSQGPAFTYSWTTSTGNIVSGANDPDPLINAPGVYELTVLNTQNGCTAIDQVDITQDDNAPTAEAVADADITCVNNQVTLDGGGSSAGPGIQYTWDVISGTGTVTAGQGTDQATVDGPGVFQLIVLDTNNDCQTVTTVAVNENTLLPTVAATADAALTCTVTEVPLSGAGSSQGPQFTYQWTTNGGNITGGQTAQDAFADAPGTYTLEVTNTVNGCANEITVTVDEDTTLPQLDILTPPMLTCGLTSTSLDATGSDQGLNFNYEWTTTGGNIVTGSTGPQPLIDAPGTYTLTLTNTENGCVSTASVTVDEDIALPEAEAGPTFELTCVLTALDLDGTGSDQGADFSYLWTATNGGIIQSGATSLTPSVTSAGTYTLTVTNGQNECTATDVVSVTENTVAPVATAASPDEITCLTDEVTIDAGGSDAGPNFSYDWTTPDGNILDETNPLAILVNAAGSYTLEITNTENGCVESFTVPVTEDVVLPGADAGPSFQLNCNLEEVVLQGSATAVDVSFDWTTSDGEITGGATTSTPAVSEPGTYSLQVTDLSNGCVSIDEVIVSENNPVEFAYDLIPPACSDDAGVIQFMDVVGGVPPYEYSVDGGSSFTPVSFFSALDPGAYDVAIQDANGCALLDEVILPQGVDVEVEIEDFALVELGDSYQIIAQTNLAPDDIAEIIWSPTAGLSCTDCLDPVISPTEQIDYKLTIRTEDGCESSEIIAIRVSKEAKVYIPNIFSPDGDGDNDIFYIFAGEQVAQVRSFLVFNRWGETVYEYYDFLPNDPAYGWDGMHRGQAVNPAVFVYYAEIEFIDGRIELFKGDVTLVR